MPLGVRTLIANDMKHLTSLNTLLDQSKLKWLQLASCSPFLVPAIKSIVPRLTSLTNLNLQNCPLLPAHVATLTTLHSLDMLDLRKISLSPEFINELRQSINSFVGICSSSPAKYTMVEDIPQKEQEKNKDEEGPMDIDGVDSATHKAKKAKTSHQ